MLKWHTDSISSVAMTSDNKYIISSSFENIVRVWDLLEKRQEAVF